MKKHKKKKRSYDIDPEIAAITEEMDKEFGGGTIVNVRQQEDLTGNTFFSTGFQEIDDVLTGRIDKHGETKAGTGKGAPSGRIIEIYGPESSSKTTLGLLMIADAQKQGKKAAFVDVEHALDIPYARKLGVDTDNLLISQPDTAEETVAIVKALVRLGVDLIVVDSVAAMTPKSELEGKGGGMGEQARIMSKACRTINAKLKTGGPCVVFINQIRYKIGVMFGNPEITTGGNALKFYASIRCDLRKIKTLTKQRKGKKKVIGVRIRLKTVKNKVVPPYRECVFDIIWNEGISIPSTEELKGQRGLGGGDE